MLARIACLSVAWCAACATPSPLPPRVVQALGGEPRGCMVACSIGTYCDPETGACISGSGGSTSSASRPTARARSVELPDGALAFACTTVDGLDDEVIASGGDAATRACETMNGVPCTCRPTSVVGRDE